MKTHQAIPFFLIILLSLSIVSCVSPDPIVQGREKKPLKKRSPLRNPDANLPIGDVSQKGISYRRINTAQPYIAITFDDGPHTTHTPRLLDILARRNIKATFYVLGSRTKDHPEIVRRIVEEGHEIGNHSWSHTSFTKLSDGAVRSELDRCSEAIYRASGVRPRTMRPPYGALHMSQRSWIHSEYGYPTILWDVDPEDWKKPGASVVADRLVSNTKRGSILLAHDIHATTIDAMPEALDTLLQRGYKFVTISQLLSLNSEYSVASE